jgi:hypothetical protein
MSSAAIMLWTLAIEAFLFPFAYRERLAAERQARAAGKAHRNRWPERAR